MSKAALAMMLSLSVPEFGSIILQAAVNDMGTVAIAAFSVARRVYNVTSCPFLAISIAGTIFVSQNLGVGNYRRMRQGLVAGNLMYLIWSAIAVAGVLLAGRPLAALISGSEDSRLLDWAYQYMLIANLAGPSLGVVLLYRQSLQGLGSRVLPVMCSVLEVLFKIVITLFVADGIHFIIICLTEPITWVVNAVILLAAYFLHYRKKLLEIPAAVR